MSYLIISGTNRKNSNSRIIANFCLQELKSAGKGAAVLDLNELPKDFAFSALYENAQKDSRFNQAQKQVDEAAKLVFIIPEYNNSIPGVLKTFIDGLRYPDSLMNKKAAMIGLSSGGQGSAIALSHFGDIASYLGMHMLALRPRLPMIDAALKDGQLVNDEYRELITTQMEQLISF